MNMRLILLVSPRDAEKIPSPPCIPCVTGCVVRREGTLFRGGRPFRGGVCAVGFEDGFQNNGNTAKEIVSYCREYGISGAYLSSGHDLSPIVRALTDNGVSVYTDGERIYDGAVELVSSAVSGGTLRERLTDEIRKYGKDRVALGVELVRCDFTLPARDGNGRSITLAETRELLRKHPSPSFTSDSLCVNYFFYREGGTMHAVLYDNSRSIIEKLRLAEDLGIRTAFLAYDEVSEILPQLTNSLRSPHGQRF